MARNFHVSLLAPGGLLMIFGIPWLIDASPDLCLYLHLASSLYVSVSKFPLFIRHFGLGSSLPQYDLIFSNNICSDSCHFLKPWGFRTSTYDLGVRVWLDTIQPITHEAFDVTKSRMGKRFIQSSRQIKVLKNN